MIIFDYIFYRFAGFFFKGDGAEASRAKAFVSLLQFFIILDIYGLIMQPLIGLERLSQTIPVGRYVAVALMVTLMIFNHFRYRNMYERYVERWQNTEAANQRLIRSFLVF